MDDWGTSGQFSIYNGDEGNDFIYSSNNDSTIKGGDGDDTIENTANRVTIDGGDGNDSIISSNERVSINGGSGNDYISSKYSQATINADTGDDTISLDNESYIYDNLIQYADGDGNDVVENYHIDDIIQITSGILNGSLISGEDVILKIGNGSITLKQAANKAITIKNVDGSMTILNNGIEPWFLVGNRN